VKPSLKRRMLLAAQAGLYRSGLAWAYTKSTASQGATILLYHSVAEPEEAASIAPANHLAPTRFREQMTFLAEHRRVVALDTLVEELRAGHTPPSGTVAITFDDGYRDNLTVAAPILDELGLPATLFLPTGWIDRNEAPWADRLHHACRERTGSRVTVDGASVEVRSSEEALALCRRLNTPLIEDSLQGREERLEALVAELAPARPTPRLLLSWDDTRELKRRFPRFGLGLHSVDHLDLTRVGETELEHQIAGGIERIQSELGEPPTGFAYPYNRHDARVRARVREHLPSAVASSGPIQARAGCDLMALPRIDPHPSHSLFAYHTSGAHPRLTRALLRRA